MESTPLSYYDKLILNFVEAMSPQIEETAFDRESHLLEFDAGEMILRVLPHTFSEEELPEPDFIRIEADLLSLDIEDHETNYRRFLLLHQFNASVASLQALSLSSMISAFSHSAK